jgi:hypothetical protein
MVGTRWVDVSSCHEVRICGGLEQQGLWRGEEHWVYMYLASFFRHSPEF